eukprot:2893508-Prymnesium_polylepis.1
MQEPVRPTRERKPVDRYNPAGASIAALAAHYVEAAGVGFDINSPRLPNTAFVVNTTDGASRMLERA